MLMAYKYRMYLNKEQQKYFAKTFGCVGFIYNRMLSDKIEYYKEECLSILYVFSCHIYGLRKYKKKIEEDEEIAKSIQSGIKANETTVAEN